jgi:hypothetical protein
VVRGGVISFGRGMCRFFVSDNILARSMRCANSKTQNSQKFQHLEMTDLKNVVSVGRIRSPLLRCFDCCESARSD